MQRGEAVTQSKLNNIFIPIYQTINYLKQNNVDAITTGQLLFTNRTNYVIEEISISAPQFIAFNSFGEQGIARDNFHGNILSPQKQHDVLGWLDYYYKILK
jgi:hypothetical protein